MSQIQWMLSIIPSAILNWIYWAIIAVGITGIAAGWVGRWIPLYGKYVQFLKPAGVVLLVLGVWLRGGYDTEMAWRARVDELQAKIKQAEVQSQEVNTTIQTQYRDKVKTVKEIQIVVQERIVKEAAKMDAECKVDPEAISILNQAAGVKK
jgi:type VI protein secretion system component VasK